MDAYPQRPRASTGGDGSTATFRPPFPVSADTVDTLIACIAHVPRTAVIAVRRGGFLAAVVDGSTVVAGDAGKRHVQGRTAAGGWSQQRFARRRDKQVHELSQAAADYAARVILPELPVAFLATGGDRPLVDEVLTDPRLRSHLALNDIRKTTLRELHTLLATCRIDLVDP
ncbi:MAG: acVLRF1 family peptidyl-tRNA hydrolase [Candidatus Nanopelagicales bacterium]